MDFGLAGSKKKKTGPTKQWTQAQIKSELANFDKKIEWAKENAGDLEVRDCVIDKACFLKDEAQDYPEAEKVYREAIEITGGASQKMEIIFNILLMNIEKFDTDALKKDIAKCHELIDQGGDWDKRNKLKIFEGVYAMIVQDFKRAADLFVSSVATFTCVELLDYKQFIFYTVVMALVTLDRKTLKTKVVQSSDVLSVIRDIPNLKQYLESFYNCEYRSFFESFAEILDQIQADIYLRDHTGYYAKEMRLVAYRQYLESFKSVTIKNMAHAFGVTETFLDVELSNFIYNGKINCKIDKVAGIIESNRPNKKQEMLNETIRQGDALLNRV